MTKSKWVFCVAIIIWLIVFGVVLGKVLQIEAISAQARSVYPLFYNVGRAWTTGSSIYTADCEYYLYWPGFAALISVLTELPFHYSVAAWVAISFTMLFSSLYLLGLLIFENYNRAGVLLLLAIPLAFEGLYNQQSNAIIMSLVIFGCVSLLKNKYWFGSVLLLVATMVKVAPIAFILLFLLVYPKKLWWRYIIVTIGLLCLPLLFGSIEYVWSQYAEWIDTLRHNAGRRWAYRDLWTLYELFIKGSLVDEPVPYWYRGIQFSGAIILAIKCIWLKYYKSISDKNTAIFVIMGASSWWLLLGPSTEISTSIAGVGVAGLGAMIAKYSRTGWYIMLVAYICVAIGSIGDYEFHMKSLTTSSWPYGLLPFGAVLMYIWVCCFSAKAIALTIGEKKVS